jgi:hypothetical protein
MADLMTSSESQLYVIGTRLSDRLGRHANVDNFWFDKLVDYWRTSDGVRIFAFELSDLGRHVVQLIDDDQSDVPEAVLQEMEIVLSEDDADSAGLTYELLEGLDAELLKVREENIVRFDSMRNKLKGIMGPATLAGWSQMGSYRSP